MPRLEDQIVEEAKTWVGVPFRHLGRNRRGVDCIGLVICVAHELNLSDFDTKQYARRPNLKEFITGFKTHMDRVDLKNAGHGHVLLTREIRFPAHCGILEVDPTGQKWLIHAYQAFGKVVRESLHAHHDRPPLFAFKYREK